MKTTKKNQKTSKNQSIISTLLGVKNIVMSLLVPIIVLTLVLGATQFYLQHTHSANSAVISLLTPAGAAEIMTVKAKKVLNAAGYENFSLFDYKLIVGAIFTGIFYLTSNATSLLLIAAIKNTETLRFL